MDKNLWKWITCFAIPAIIYFMPIPAGLSVQAWQLFAVYIAAILGLMLRPATEPVVLLVIIAASSIIFKNGGAILSGYSSSTTWLVFTAFMVGTAFIETGLGRRIAYYLIGKFGKTSLRLGYIAALTDMVISPATPSNTARTGGIVFPIFRSIANTLDSKPGPTSRRIGAYLTLTLYQISLTTGYMFITAIAPNALMITFAKNIMKIEISWMGWAIAAFVPAIICLSLIPWVVYKLYPPEMKEIDNVHIAEKGAAELGPISAREIRLALLFVLAIIGWATGSITKIGSAYVALAFVALVLLTKVITWENLVNTKGAWNTLIWYGGIIGIATSLAKAKFFVWLAALTSKTLHFGDYPTVLILAALVLFSLVIRYLFASMGVFVATMIPVFFTLGMVANVPPMPLVFLISFAASYGCLLTHYGGALGPVLFGDGYVDQATWWKVGAVIALMSFAIHICIGLPYWKIIGLW